MLVYLDESGDLGWTFSHPFRHGGSSRYLCLAFLFLPKEHKKVPRKIISNLYSKYRWVDEMKASHADKSIKLEFAAAMNSMLDTHADIKVDCIVVKKENVQPHIRRDGNKIYNYMCKMVIPSHVKDLLSFHFHPDKRSIKVDSGKSLPNYLEMVLGFEFNSATVLHYEPKESTGDYNLQFVDWVANSVWKHYEDGESEVYNQISPKIRVRNLYFTPQISN